MALPDGLLRALLVCALLLHAGIGVAGQALGAYLLSTEMVGPMWRGVAGIITQVSSLLWHSAALAC